uniref:HMA domain-containing protein n=1 Tax=Nelumbo nucifera TaxID=4432 RepID=A0A822ZBF9_NELNU|nr:TPA_asm: hypothetical protein HUJ06_015108 [Nelumbo nucifera]
MVQTTVMKVNIYCQKCKQELISAISGLRGVDKVEVDVANGTLTVTGTVDPYDVLIHTKKTGKFVDVVSIGPPPKSEANNNPEPKVDNVTFHGCEQVCIIHVDEPDSGCSIM